jgi:hypothetical protein
MWLHTICCCTFFLCGLPEAGIATHAFGNYHLSRPTHIQAKAKETKYPMGETAQIVLRTHGCWSYDSRRRRRLVCSLAPLPTDITICRRTYPNRCSGPFPKCKCRGSSNILSLMVPVAPLSALTIEIKPVSRARSTAGRVVAQTSPTGMKHPLHTAITVESGQCNVQFSNVQHRSVKGWDVRETVPLCYSLSLVDLFHRSVPRAQPQEKQGQCRPPDDLDHPQRIVAVRYSCYLCFASTFLGTLRPVIMIRPYTILHLANNITTIWACGGAQSQH